MLTYVAYLAAGQFEGGAAVLERIPNRSTEQPGSLLPCL